MEPRLQERQETTIFAVVRGDRLVKPYTYPAQVEIKFLTAVTEEQTLLERLADLRELRLGIVNALVASLKASRDPATIGPRYASIEIWAGIGGKIDPLQIGITAESKRPLLWSIVTWEKDKDENPGAPIFSRLPFVMRYADMEIGRWLVRLASGIPCAAAS